MTIRDGTPLSSVSITDRSRVLRVHDGPVSLYSDLGGFDAILDVCIRWHELCLANPVAAHPFEHPLHPGHDVRLAAYLAEATGGPRLYTAGYGDESFMQREHAGNGIHPELDEACLACFDQAIEQIGVPQNAGAKLSDYFRLATTVMGQYGRSPDDVPEGLPLFMAE